MAGKLYKICDIQPVNPKNIPEKPQEVASPLYRRGLMFLRFFIFILRWALLDLAFTFTVPHH